MKQIISAFLVTMSFWGAQAKDICLDELLLTEEKKADAEGWDVMDISRVQSNEVEALVVDAIEENSEEVHTMLFLSKKRKTEFYVISWSTQANFGETLVAMEPMGPVLDMPNIPVCEKVSEVLLSEQG